MKKIILVMMMAVAVLPANAQFEKGKVYANASLSGLGLSYSGSEKFQFNIGAFGGYFIANSWMLYARIDYYHQSSVSANNIALGLGGRYYIVQNGLYLNLGLQYEHVSPNINNFQICPEIGYTFFLNQHVTVEPSIYYNMSVNNFSNGSKVGLRVGFGYFF